VIRYAEGTSVSIGRSRGQIDDLLRAWGCTGTSWTDDWESGVAVLQFRWRRAEDEVYLARFTLRLPSEEQLRQRARHERTGKVLDTKLAKLRKEAGQQEYRVLFIWLNGAFNAVEAGIVTAETVFLPFLVGNDGRTVAEVALPRMKHLLSAAGAQALLPGPGAD
jgi:hypothetical protein